MTIMVVAPPVLGCRSLALDVLLARARFIVRLFFRKVLSTSACYVMCNRAVKYLFVVAYKLVLGFYISKQSPIFKILYWAVSASLSYAFLLSSVCVFVNLWTQESSYAFRSAFVKFYSFFVFSFFILVKCIKCVTNTFGRLVFRKSAFE